MRKNASDNKHLWKTGEPLLSEKLTHEEKINLPENREILKTDM